MLANVRDAVMGGYAVVAMSHSIPTPWQQWRHMLLRLWYTCTVVPSRKRRTLMDIPRMVEGWHQVVLALSTAHDKDTIDHAEFAIEELMAPLLTAPVRQLRAFWTQLEYTLQEDPRVPFFVWRMFAAYGEVVVQSATDAAVIELKTALAREIAALVEQEVQPDITEAIAGALRWRHPETLMEIRDAVKAGKKPRLQGRESCLFLVVGDYEVML